MYTLKLFLVILLFYQCYGAKILGVFPSTGYSQFILAEKLMKELVARGHDVTVISAFKPKQSVDNYRTIEVDGLIKHTEGDLFQQNDQNVITNIATIYEFGHMLTEFILQHKNVQNLIRSNEHFDLVIVEQFFNEAHMGFAAHFNAPLVLFSSIGPTEWNTYLVGQINLPSSRATSFSSFTDNMNFIQRFQNTFFYFFDLFYKHFSVYKAQQNLIDTYFPKPMPNLKNLLYNASLMLLNSDVSTSEAAILPKLAVEIGGFHVNENPNPLPKDIQKFLDEAEHGAILFSLGSNLNSTNLSKEKLDTILRVFSKLKQRILWKFEKDFPNKPDNLLVSKWLPQSDILAHRKVLLFITHGGLLSTTEAVYRGVPIVGIPVFGDQNMNMARACKNGLGVKVELNQLSDEETFYGAIKTVLENDSFKRTATKLSKILRTQPVKQIDLAMYWIEYVIKFNGAPHLQHSAINLKWYQLYLVDIFICLLFLFAVFCFVIKFVLFCVFAKKKKIKVN